MENSKQTLSKSVRVTGMVVGFSFFMLFVYKASHDVSNARIAAGAERRRALAAARQAKTAPVTTNSSFANQLNVLPISSTPTPKSVNAASEATSASQKQPEAETEQAKVVKSIKRDDTAKLKPETKNDN